MKTSLSLESLFDIAGVLQVAPRALLDFRDEKPQDFHLRGASYEQRSN